MNHFFSEYKYECAAVADARARGSVLIAVLGVLLMLSILVTLFIEETIQTLEYESLGSPAQQVEREAYAALELSLAVLAEIAELDEGLYAPEQGWHEHLVASEAFQQLGSGIEVELIDASGQIPINTMSEEALNEMLEEVFELDFGTARTMSSALLDWIDEDESRRLNGAESAEYMRASVPYRAANQPLRSLHELRWVEGWREVFFNEQGTPNEDFNQLSQLVTTRPVLAINLNAAPEEVLDLLASGASWDPSFLFDGLGEDYLTMIPDAESAQDIGVTFSLLQIVINVNRGGLNRTLSAWVIPNFEAVASNSAQSESDMSRKLGSTEEQTALGYPFQIVEISWHQVPRPPEPARYESLGLKKSNFSPSLPLSF